MVNPWYFTGLVDGEGSFNIMRAGPVGRKRYQPSFAILLRKDNFHLLRELQKQFGGNLTPYKDKNKKHGVIHWRITKKSEMVTLANHFDKYPLQGIKAVDYIHWRYALVEYLKPPAERDEQKMKNTKEAMQAFRK